MGFRVIKTAIATVLAIIISDAFNIEGALSAGLLAILGVDVTRKRSIATVSSRFFASILGLIMAFILFYILGFHIWVLAVYILIAFPLLSRANFKEGIVTSSVVVFRVFGGEVISLQVMATQIELLLIGLGSAMIVNLLYMPKEEDKLIKIRFKVDGLFSVIFKHIAISLRDPEHLWDGKELIEAGKLVDEGLASANRALENQLISPNEAWNVYFYMRKQQLDRIEGMLEMISLVYERIPQGEAVATLFEQLSVDVTREFYSGQTEEMQIQLDQQFKQMKLPASREEFELRAHLLQLSRELAYFLEIAKKDKSRRTVQNSAGADAEES